MPANTFGEIFRITTFGESHGDGIGVVVDGCPAGFKISEADIQSELDRRRPGQSHITTGRNEPDKVKILSGIYNGKTTGTPIAMVVFNADQRSQDYDELQNLYRPGHSDFTYQEKYQNRDPRGGGRSSARIMIGRVAAGAIAKKFLKEKLGAEFLAYTSQVGEVKFDSKDFSKVQLESERLVFKPISLDYLEEIDTEFTDKVAKYIRLNLKSNESISKTAEFLSGTVNKHNQNEELTFVVLEKETKQFLGVCSVHDIQTGNISFGLWVKESSWGKGFGKEIIGTLKNFVEENLNLSSLTYVAFEENLGSRKIAESFGGVELSRKFVGVFKDDGKEGVEITYQIPFKNKKVDFYETVTSDQIEANIVRCPDPEVATKMIELIEKAKAEKDSLGGVITGVIRGLPVGLGEPEFDKFPALLAHAMLSINATKGFEIGSGFEGTKLKGSQHNDEFVKNSNQAEITTKTNHAGGVLGGITNGQTVYFNVAFKPVATIGKPQKTIDNQGNEVIVEGKGRHDPCVLPRAVPIVEAMSALVAMDLYLRDLKK